MNITESIKFDKLQEENQVLKNQLAEKDKEINSFTQQIDMAHNFNQNLGSEIEELKQQILFKEDFVIYSFGCDKCNLSYSCKNKCKLFWALKDNSKYDKLPSKEDK